MASEGDSVDLFKRLFGSHVHDDGRAKIAYATYSEAAANADQVWARTGRPHAAYKCSQNPVHYHVGRGTADLDTGGNE